MKESPLALPTDVKAVKGILAVSTGKMGLEGLTGMTKTRGRKALKQPVRIRKKTMLPLETGIRNTSYRMMLAHGQSNNPWGKVTVK